MRWLLAVKEDVDGREEGPPTWICNGGTRVEIRVKVFGYVREPHLDELIDFLRHELAEAERKQGGQ